MARRSPSITGKHRAQGLGGQYRAWEGMEIPWGLGSALFRASCYMDHLEI